MITALADGAIFAEKSGSTPPRVVALHGWGRTGSDFAAVVGGLDAISLHLPGFGPSPEPPEAWGSVEYADAVAAALEPYGPTVVMGHSFGGRVAVRLASRHPHLVAGLVLTGVPLVRLVAAPKPKLGFRVVRGLAHAGLVPKSVLESQRRKHGSADYRAAQGVIRDILVRLVGETYDDDLARIAAPTRMVWGERDTAAPADAGLAASRLIPGARFRVVEGAGHLLDDGLVAPLREELLAMLEETA